MCMPLFNKNTIDELIVSFFERGGLVLHFDD